MTQGTSLKSGKQLPNPTPLRVPGEKPCLWSQNGEAGGAAALAGLREGAVQPRQPRSLWMLLGGDEEEDYRQEQGR